jgi:transcription-repair coupling factor (superfamily II helicase)
VARSGGLGRDPRRPPRAPLRPQPPTTPEATSLSPAISWSMSTTASAASSGCKTIEAAGAPHDCLEIHYAGGDKLFLPVENIELLSRYGSEDAERPARPARRRRLADAQGAAEEAHPRDGGRADQDRGRAQLREAPSAVPPPGALRRVLRPLPLRGDRGPARAIDAVLADLASGRPMDRLVCGDVGFGKTEVALRAASSRR